MRAIFWRCAPGIIRFVFLGSFSAAEEDEGIFTKLWGLDGPFVLIDGQIEPLESST
jgi:hypothetical protein